MRSLDKSLMWILLLGSIALLGMRAEAGLMDKLKAGNNKLKELAKKKYERDNPSTFGGLIVKISQEDPKMLKDM